MSIRIIPRLDVKGPNLVKGIHLEGLRILGPVEQFAQYYYENGADELIYIDAVSSLYGRNSLVDVIRETSSKIFIPLCVGGGLRSLDNIAQVLRAGADKVAINSAAIKRPSLVREASTLFGSSTVVVSIDSVKRQDNKYECFIDNGREATGKDVFEWAIEAEQLGAGELLITSVDREGTGEGYDLNLIKTIADSVNIPVISCGGGGEYQHVEDALSVGHADAISIASLLHYYVAENIVIDDLKEVVFGLGAENRNTLAKIKHIDIVELKKKLISRQFDVKTH